MQMHAKAPLLVSALVVVAACMNSCGGGGGGGGSAPVLGVPVVPRFAYVVNNLDNSVSIYTVDAATGQLRSNGYVAAGTGPFSVITESTGGHAYVGKGHRLP